MNANRYTNTNETGPESLPNRSGGAISSESGPTTDRESDRLKTRSSEGWQPFKDFSGQKIRLQRKETGTTLVDVSRSVGASVATVSEWEREESCPTVEQFDLLIHFFGCTKEELQ